jgi:hypothetical protein
MDFVACAALASALSHEQRVAALRLAGEAAAQYSPGGLGEDIGHRRERFRSQPPGV